MVDFLKTYNEPKQPGNTPKSGFTINRQNQLKIEKNSGFFRLQAELFSEKDEKPQRTHSRRRHMQIVYVFIFYIFGKIVENCTFPPLEILANCRNKRVYGNSQRK